MTIIRNAKISTKIFMIIIGAIVVIIGAVIINTTIANQRMMNYLLLGSIQTSMSTKVAMIDQRTSETFGVALAAAANTALVNALSTGSENLIYTLATEEMTRLLAVADFDFLIATDINGNILYSSLSAYGVGESVLHIPSISQALIERRVFSDIEIHGFIPFASVTTMPLYALNGAAVGVLAIGADLANPAFVDRIADSARAAVTMFAGSERVMTSIEYLDGVRAVGTFLAEPMYSAVFTQGTSLKGHALILEQPHYVYYRPFFNSSGEVIGSFFVGINFTTVQAEVSMINATTLGIALFTTAISLLIAFAVTQRLITKPIHQITSSFDALSNGHMAINMPSTTTKDEIGSLSRAGTQMAAVISSLIEHVNASVDDVLKGKLRVRIDHTLYEGDFKLLAKGVNQVIGAGEKDITDIFETLKGFSAGDFNVPLRALPGERKIYNDIIENLRFNLQDIASQLEDIIHTASTGNLDKRAHFENHTGDWAAILIDINQFLEIVETPITEAKNSLQAIQQGDFSLPITGDYQGVFQMIKTSVNETITIISSYITEISEILGYITNDDDFTNKIERSYAGSFRPIKDSINNLVDKLNTIIKSISDNAANVLQGAEVIAQTSSSIANGATEQSINLKTLSNSLDELTVQVDSNYESAREASQFSEESKANSNTGNAHMQTTLTAMNDISESSKDILSILKVINDIAFQTNLLALNAAVEAARAGVHGRGFAVVAEEVRALAGRSEAASRETNEKVLEIISKIESGQTSTENTAKSFELILESAGKVARLIQNIEVQSQEQSQVIKQISQNTTQISEVVSNNTSLSEESAASSQELNSRAETMSQLVKQYKIST